MPDTNEILDHAGKLGEMIASHPAVTKYKDAQKAVSSDPEAGRLLGEFEKELMQLSRLEAQGMEISPAQQQKLQQLQGRIVSNLRIKALNLAEVDFYDLLRKVNQTMLRPIGGSMGGAGGGAGGPGAGPAAGPRIVGG
jgi:cell fate (sporulation/competence/biofilm development) regulator YlbF (YheA/YmcA/DUF963 family)